MQTIIDFHTHAFPDTLAERAISSLEAEGRVKAFHRGTVSSLIETMDSAGIEKSILCSIATKPSQFEDILAWSKSIRSSRIEPLPSIHPADPDPKEKIKIIAQEGFLGIKLHPFYQDFEIGDPLLYPIWESLVTENLMVVFHAGHDIAFAPHRRASPTAIYTISQAFPTLLIVATHLGGYYMWDEVETTLAGSNVYIETSFTFPYLSPEKVKKIIAKHHPKKILFGSDSPWADPGEDLLLLNSLNLSPTLLQDIQGENASTLLSSLQK